MAAYRRVYDSRHLQADCKELGSAPEPYALRSSMGYLYLFISCTRRSSTANQPHFAAIEGTDRQTDRRTPDRYTDHPNTLRLCDGSLQR